MDEEGFFLLLTIIKLVIFLLCLLLFFVCGLTEYAKANSPAYKRSVELIRKNEQVKLLFGDRIRRDWFINGSTLPNKESGKIQFTYSVIGKVRAKVQVTAIQHGPHLNAMTVTVSIKKNNSEIIISE